MAETKDKAGPVPTGLSSPGTSTSAANQAPTSGATGSIASGPSTSAETISSIPSLMADQRRRSARGEEFRIEGYLSRHPHLRDDHEALLDMIYHEIILREQLGESPSLAEYQTRFPALVQPLADLFEVHRAIEHGAGVSLAGSVTKSELTKLVKVGEPEPTPPAREPPLPARAGYPLIEGYEIRDVLGSGGMGVVYRAHDCRRGVPVAIKTMRQADAASLYRFKQEFRALLDVSHPNLINLYELLSDGQSWFIVMEYVDGVNFLDYVRGGLEGRDVESTALESTWSMDRPAPEPSTPQATGEYGPESGAGVGARAGVSPAHGLVPTPVSLGPKGRARLRQALKQLAEGLTALHQAGKLHRDIKPSNVLVARNGRVVIMDFGLVTTGAREGLDLSTEGHVVGTAAYMAPEQAAGQRPTPAVDWYGVGVMLYEAITGRRPFQGGTLQLLQDKQKYDPPTPSELVSGVPEDLDGLCVELLRRNPEARPTGREVLRRLGATLPEHAAGVGSSSSLCVEPRFVGREAHRAALRDALEATRAGRTVVVSVRGPSGMGKSALVQKFLDDVAAGDEAVTLAGRCYERESVPYKALDSLIDSLSRYLRRLPTHEVEALLPREVSSLVRTFPVLRRVEAISAAPKRDSESPDPQELRRRAYAALRELLARLGDRRTLVLAIDDLQWGDPDSLAVLAEVLRPTDPPILLLLACYRSDETSPATSLDGVGGVDLDRRDLDVGPLVPDDALALARQLLMTAGPDTEHLAEAVARESGGNPFFAAELARSVLAGGPEVSVASEGRVALDEVLWSRIVTLPEEARKLLEVVAVSGGPISPSIACQCLDHPCDERAAFALLRTARLVRGARGSSAPDVERVETYHDRVRETVVARLTSDELRERHRSLARALEAAGHADPELLGAHYLSAGESGRAAELFIRAAQEAAEALAFGRASVLYRRAIDLQPENGPQSRQLRASLAEALTNAGRGAEAAEAYLAACDGANVAEAREFCRRAAMQFLISGHIDRGLDTLRVVLEAVGMTLPRTPRRALISLLLSRGLLRLRGLHFRPRDASEISAADLTRIDVCWSTGIGLGNVDWIRGANFQTRGLILALRAGEPYRVARALTVEAAQTATAGVSRTQATARVLHMAGALARSSGEPYALGMVALAEGVSAYLETRWADALAACDRSGALFRDHCTGVAWELDTAHAYALWALSHLGRWAELSRRFPVLINEARERGDLYAEMNLSTYILSIVRIAADEPKAAHEETRQVMGQWSREGYHVQHNDLVWAIVQTDLYQGNGMAAWDGLLRHWPTLARSLLLRVQFIRVAMWGLRARCAIAAASVSGSSDRAKYLRAAARDAARLRRERLLWADAQARMVQAGAAALNGRPLVAAGLLREAAAVFRGCEMALCAAVADRRLGTLLGGDEGRSLVQRADAVLASESVRQPARVADMFAPGFLVTD